MYSDEDIVKAVRDKRIIIRPYDAKLLKTCSYTLTLDSELAIAVDGEVDPLKTKDYAGMYKRTRIKKGKTFELRPGQFILARTKERVGMDEGVGMLIDGTTTFARLGVTIIQTAMLVHSGHGWPKPRKIVLEIKNNGPFSVHLTTGMKVADGIFFRLETPTKNPYDSVGKYGKRLKKDDLFPLRQ